MYFRASTNRMKQIDMTTQIGAEEPAAKAEGIGEISDDVDWNGIRIVAAPQRRIEIELPDWVIDGLDQTAQQYGVERSALVKIWLGERLERRRP